MEVARSDKGLGRLVVTHCQFMEKGARLEI